MTDRFSLKSAPSLSVGTKSPLRSDNNDPFSMKSKRGYGPTSDIASFKKSQAGQDGAPIAEYARRAPPDSLPPSSLVPSSLSAHLLAAPGHSGGSGRPKFPILRRTGKRGEGKHKAEEAGMASEGHTLKAALQEMETSQTQVLQSVDALVQMYPKMFAEFEDNVMEVLDSQMSIFDQQTQDLIECNQQQARQIAELLRRQQELDQELQAVTSVLRNRPTLSSTLLYLWHFLLTCLFFLRKLFFCRRQ